MDSLLARLAQTEQKTISTPFWKVPGRVAYIVNHSYPFSSNGYAVRTQGVAQALVEYGYSVVAITRPGRPWDLPGFDDANFESFHEIEGVRYIHIKEPSITNKSQEEYLTQCVIALKKYLQLFKPSVVMAASNWENALPAAIAARELGLPFFYEVRGFWEISRASMEPAWQDSDEFKFQVKMETTVAKQAEWIFTLNQFMCEELVKRGLNEAKIDLIPNGYETHFGLNLPPLVSRHDLGISTRFVVGYIGSFNSYEGLDDLVQACAQLRNQGVDLSLLLVGSSDHVGIKGRTCSATLELTQLATTLSFNDYLFIPGRVSNKHVGDYYHMINLVVIPRKTLPVCQIVSPIKPLEAIAYNKTLLVSDVRPLQEIVESSKAGSVFKAGNLDELVIQISLLLQQVEETPKKLATTAQKWINEQRSWSKVILPICKSKQLCGQQKKKSPKRTSPGKRIRVAAVMDEFTFQCFEPECDLKQISPKNWQSELDDFKPNMLFIESAWRGLDELWKNMIFPASNEIKAVVKWCNQHRITTVFWNKEDPFSFDRFLPIARMVDYIFTTDFNSIGAYKRALDHDRIFLLPFAAQPKIHNPVEIYERRSGACFAGSYYWKYKHRMRDFDIIMNSVKGIMPVTIYDRNFERPKPHDFEYPERYRKHIEGTLPYSEINKAYKGFLFSINMSTSKESPTMFARRVFELIASNTITISNYALAVRLFFGDLVVSSDNESQIEKRLKELVIDNSRYRKIRLWALRRVLLEHTYRDRFALILSKALKIHYEKVTLKICIVGQYVTLAERDMICEAWQRQDYTASLIIIGPQIMSKPLPKDILRIDRFENEACLELQKYEYIAVFSPEDYYGRNYLLDFSLAMNFTNGGVGKVALYTMDNGSMRLSGNGEQYHYTDTLDARSSMVKVTEGNLVKLQQSDINFIEWCDDDFLALDEFSYCLKGAKTIKKAEQNILDISPVNNEGIPFQELISMPAPEQPKPESWSLSIFEFSKYLRKKRPANVVIEVKRDCVYVKSSFPKGTFCYTYLENIYTLSSLKLDDNVRCQLKAKGDGDVKLVIVYCDKDGEKISHLMFEANRKAALAIPLECEKVKLGLRIAGTSEVSLTDIEFTIESDVPSFMPANKTLLCVSQYPSYEDLYHYAFVHSRVMAFKCNDVNVDVMTVNNNEVIRTREFSGVNITEGNLELLIVALALNHYERLIIHSLTAAIMNAIRPYLGKLRIIIWSHGADIQPWFRRFVRFTSDRERVAARRRAFEREGFWRELLAGSPDKTQIVFVSRFQAREALCDLGVKPNASIYVIPNPIETDLFHYVPKKEDDRFKVLSIRPFANRIYANDLTVQAILLLSKGSNFDHFHFTIVGDGPLFDETVEPLRQFLNVSLHKCFVTQEDIVKLHAKNGVFLCPSRMDTHGVSRDEAMASGLVPVTSRVAAIPEFVDEECGFLAEPEDAVGLADAITSLAEDPQRFLAMSTAAAKRIRRTTTSKNVIKCELEVINSPKKSSQIAEINGEATRYRIAIYGDVNLNIMDGSAIWAVSLAETMSLIPHMEVTLFLKAPVIRLHVIEPLLALSGKVRIVEPDLPEDKALLVESAIIKIGEAHKVEPFDAIILRGLNLCTHAINERWKNRIWAYITDLPQVREDLDDDSYACINNIIQSCERLLCQTKAFERYVCDLFPSAQDKTAILPPMIPLQESKNVTKKVSSQHFRMIYAGKFAPLWGVRELFRAFTHLRQTNFNAELHVYGDKFHNPKDDPEFRNDIKNALATEKGVIWHGAVDRSELLKKIPEMDVAWGYRDAELESKTHELSTKLLEYAASGVPIIVARNSVNQELLGNDYPLFANTEEEATKILVELYCNADILHKAQSYLIKVKERYTFPVVAEQLSEQFSFN